MRAGAGAGTWFWGVIRRAAPYVLGAELLLGAGLALDWRDVARASGPPPAEGAARHGPGPAQRVPAGIATPGHAPLEFTATRGAGCAVIERLYADSGRAFAPALAARDPQLAEDDLRRVLLGTAAPAPGASAQGREQLYLGYLHACIDP